MRTITKRFKSIFSIVICCVSVADMSFAIDTPDVLPIGVRNAAIRYGTISGLNEYYTDSGELKYLSDINAVELNAATLTQIEPSVQNLINVLNQFGQQNIGNQLNLGRLTVDAAPSVNYLAPVMLYGATNKLTFGVAVPVVFYNNTITITNEGSNLNQLRQEFGDMSQEISAAFNQLDRDMRGEFQKALTDKGYEPIESKSETFIGDVQLISAYQFYNTRDTKQAAQFFLSLPTGPKPDADDLTDIENFGRWSVRPNWVIGHRLNSRYTLLGSASYLMVIPGKVEKRVPLNSFDHLPAADQKMTLTEDIGDSASISGGVAYRYSTNLTTGFGYTYETKMSDSYTGAPDNRNQYLEQNTNRTAHIAKVEFTYSVIEDYFRKHSPVPGSINYELSRVVGGVNIENQTRHEITLNLYF